MSSATPCARPPRQNPENLLIFAAGNDGDVNDGRSVCTISSPAITKNVLAVGATSSGESRITLTAADGTTFDGTNGFADIDTVASFSSYGPTLDNRIKPEIVAPGDMVSAFALFSSVESFTQIGYIVGRYFMIYPIPTWPSRYVRADVFLLCKIELMFPGGSRIICGLLYTSPNPRDRG